MKTNRKVIVPPMSSHDEKGSALGSEGTLLSELLEALSGLRIGSAVFDTEGRCCHCSSFVSELLVSRPRNKSDFVSRISAQKPMREKILSAMCARSSRPVPISLHFTEELLLRLDFIPLVVANRTFEAVLVRDISSENDKHRQMARLNRLAVLGQVAAGALHEFNNNLTSVLGWSQIARQNTDAGSPAFPALEIIEDNARKAKRIFTRLLGTSRSGDSRPPIRVSPAKIVDDVLTLLHFEMKHASIELVRTFDEDVGLCLVDEDAIGQVLINIIRNAVDAVGSGGRIEVGILRDADTVRITVKDNGPGMAPEVVEQVFDAFFSTKRRSDPSTSGGTGLGLSISLDIVQQHGGDITVESVPGGWTCFTVSLPLTEESEDAPEKEELMRDSSPTIPPDALVLVADDEPDVGEMIRMSLELQGISVLSVKSGEDAVSECKRFRFDAAFVDYSMPGLSGHELGVKLQSIQPNLPIIFMSGLTVKKSSVAEDFLKKPFGLDEIRAILYRVLKRRKERERDPQ